LSFGRFLFLDSCVVIVDVFHAGPDLESVKRMKDLAKKEGIALLITTTSSAESIRNVRGLITLVGNELRELYSALLEKKETSDADGTLGKVSNEDMEFIAGFLRDLRRRHKAKPDLRIKLRSIETLVTDYVEEAENSKNFTISEVLTSLIAEIFELEDQMTSALLVYAAVTMNYVVADSAVKALRRAIPKIRKNNDARILLEANEHRKLNPRTLLVSLDDRDIVDQSDAIMDEIGLRCSNPAQAVRRVRNL